MSYSAIEPLLRQISLETGQSHIQFSVQGSSALFEGYGSRRSMYLEQQTGAGKAQVFCLSKRNKTLLQLGAEEGGIRVPAYQVLQIDDLILILSCLLSGEDMPNAYHIEVRESRLG